MILAVALVLAAQPDNPRWIEHYRDGTQAFAFDAATLRVDGDRRIIWRRISHLAPLPNGATASFFNVEIDCRARSSTILAALQRDQSDRVIQEDTYPAPRGEVVAAGTVGEQLLEMMCSPRP